MVQQKMEPKIMYSKCVLSVRIVILLFLRTLVSGFSYLNIFLHKTYLPQKNSIF